LVVSRVVLHHSRGASVIQSPSARTFLVGKYLRRSRS
jgi:hypothetical protein